jgi:hypothetical protein
MRASGALQTRDRHKLGVWNDPASAVHRFALHHVRGRGYTRALACTSAGNKSSGVMRRAVTPCSSQ